MSFFEDFLCFSINSWAQL